MCLKPLVSKMLKGKNYSTRKVVSLAVDNKLGEWGEEEVLADSLIFLFWQFETREYVMLSAHQLISNCYFLRTSCTYIV